MRIVLSNIFVSLKKQVNVFSFLDRYYLTSHFRRGRHGFHLLFLAENSKI